jgi:hypothetical protein
LEDSTACGLISTILELKCDTVPGITAANSMQQIQKAFLKCALRSCDRGAKIIVMIVIVNNVMWR